MEPTKPATQALIVAWFNQYTHTPAVPQQFIAAGYGSRSAVDSALHRLHRSHKIDRVKRGVYVCQS